MNYYIVGDMSCGKSTFGRNLAAPCGMESLDLDRAFEEQYHYTVSRFFAQFGEEPFRRLESLMLQTTADLDNTVIATGGGTPCYMDNMDFILRHGTAIYLRMDVDSLVQRAIASRNPRPAMRGLTEQELREKIERQLSEREPYYLRATIIVDGLNPQLPQLEF